MKKIALLFGGRSGEHTVSLASASYLLSILRTLPVSLYLIGVGRDGRLLWLPTPPDTLREGEWEKAAIPLTLCYPSPHTVRFQAATGEVFFPDGFLSVIHGTYGEDGALQGALTLSGAPFFGSGITASALGMHKALAKRLAAAADIPVVPFSHHICRGGKACPRLSWAFSAVRQALRLGQLPWGIGRRKRRGASCRHTGCRRLFLRHSGGGIRPRSGA